MKDTNPERQKLSSPFELIYGFVLAQFTTVTFNENVAIVTVHNRDTPNPDDLTYTFATKKGDKESVMTIAQDQTPANMERLEPTIVARFSRKWQNLGDAIEVIDRLGDLAPYGKRDEYDAMLIPLREEFKRVEATRDRKLALRRALGHPETVRPLVSLTIADAIETAGDDLAQMALIPTLSPDLPREADPVEAEADRVMGVLMTLDRWDLPSEEVGESVALAIAAYSMGTKLRPSKTGPLMKAMVRHFIIGAIKVDGLTPIVPIAETARALTDAIALIQAEPHVIRPDDAQTSIDVPPAAAEEKTQRIRMASSRAAGELPRVAQVLAHGFEVAGVTKILVPGPEGHGGESWLEVRFEGEAHPVVTPPPIDMAHDPVDHLFAIFATILRAEGVMIGGGRIDTIYHAGDGGEGGNQGALVLNLRSREGNGFCLRVPIDPPKDPGNERFVYHFFWSGSNEFRGFLPQNAAGYRRVIELLTEVIRMTEETLGNAAQVILVRRVLYNLTEEAKGLGAR